MMSLAERVVFRQGDLDSDSYSAAAESEWVAWDIETSGLDWSSDDIGTCQIATPDRVAVVQLKQGEAPPLLCSLLESVRVRKVFHHAPFDLRFMMAKWDVEPQNVACTKIASKILNPDLPSSDHSLKSVLSRQLGLSISKAQQRSDWLAVDLSMEQLVYAAADVAYLIPLVHTLLLESARSGLTDLLQASWAYLPTRVRLDLRGSGDVFTY